VKILISLSTTKNAKLTDKQKIKKQKDLIATLEKEKGTGYKDKINKAKARIEAIETKIEEKRDALKEKVSKRRSVVRKNPAAHGLRTK
jgi:hypothetical protein